MKKQLADMINEFLMVHKVSGGGWPEVTLNESIQLNDILYMLVYLKWDKDPDGDLPIDWILVDKTKYQLPPFIPVKHSWPSEKKDRAEILRDLNSNLQMAADRLDSTIRIFYEDL